MPSPIATAGGTKARTDSGNGAAPAAVTPFVRASMRHREQVADLSLTQTTSDIDFPQTDVNAYGFMRYLTIFVTSTLGAGTSVTATEDAPFNMLKNIQVIEPNGSQLFNVSSGYSLYQINKLGGYFGGGYSEFKRLPPYLITVGTSALVGFVLKIPFELNERDGLGSLPNQNAAATFKLKMTLAKIADVFGGTVSTPPLVRVRVYLEAWDQPEPASNGIANQQDPPCVNTTQFWSEQIFNVSAGQQTIKLTRLGNYLRNLIFIFRSSAARSTGDTNWPDPVTLALDTRNIDVLAKGIWQSVEYERYGLTGTADATGARDNGVYPYDFCSEFDGTVGFENRDLWVPTQPSTRLELQGNFGASGVLTVLTNDVNPFGNPFI